MIFTRRTIQRCLDELAELPRGNLDYLVAKLNKPSIARLPTMWEVVILHALRDLGRLEYERRYQTGRAPDISFHGENGLSFVADVTCASDAGLDEANPADALSHAIEACKSRLGLPAGGTSIRIEGEHSHTTRGVRTRLSLPPRSQIADFVRIQVEPTFREQLQAGLTVLEYSVNVPGIHFAVRIDGGPNNHMSYPSYDAPGSLKLNPLHNALKAKVSKLQGIGGLKGIIVCDGDCATMRPKTPASDHRFSERRILDQFLKEPSPIQFAVAISVKEDWCSWRSRPTKRELVVTFAAQRGLAEAAALEELFRAMVERMPLPNETPINAARRARVKGFGLGKHGGGVMTDRSLKISSRLLVEVLAGRRPIEELYRFQGWRSIAAPQDDMTMPNPFERWLSEGRLPVEMNVEPDPEGTDDWIEFKFGDPDPAVSRFRVPS